MDGEFRIAVKGFIMDDEENLLILKRSPDDVQRPEIWELPGGRLNPLEDPISGLRREIKEETGLSVEVVHPINVRHFTRQDGQTITMIIFLCKTSSKEVTIGEEHTGYKWVYIDQAKGSIDSWFYPEVDAFQRFFRNR